MLYINFKMKEIRKLKGISQQNLAKSLNTTQQQVSKYEKMIEAPTMNRLVEIASVLGVTLDELVEFKKIHHDYSAEIKKKFK